MTLSAFHSNSFTSQMQIFFSWCQISFTQKCGLQLRDGKLITTTQPLVYLNLPISYFESNLFVFSWLNKRMLMRPQKVHGYLKSEPEISVMGSSQSRSAEVKHTATEGGGIIPSAARWSRIDVCVQACFRARVYWSPAPCGWQTHSNQNTKLSLPGIQPSNTHTNTNTHTAKHTRAHTHTVPEGKQELEFQTHTVSKKVES